MFRRLQRLLICLSHKRTVAYLDKLGEKHDALVHGWKQSILEARVVEPQVRSVATIYNISMFSVLASIYNSSGNWWV